MSGNNATLTSAALLIEAVSRPVKAKRVELDRDASVAATFVALVPACLAQMQANETGLLAGRNPEFLHQFRVGLRRLRSAFRTYRPVIEPESYAAMTAEMSWLSGALGTARDWDVFLQEAVVPLVHCEPAAPGLAAFRRRCSEQRCHHAQAARQAVSAPRYASLKLELNHFIATPFGADNDAAPHLLALPVTAFAALRLMRREKRARRLAKDLDTADAARRHRLRIAAKKLRYAVEFFQSLFERKAAATYAAALAEMQDALGKLNDCATARRPLECVPAGRDAVSDARARGLVLGWIAAQERQGLVALDIGRRRWRGQAHFWEDALPRN